MWSFLIAFFLVAGQPVAPVTVEVRGLPNQLICEQVRVATYVRGLKPAQQGYTKNPCVGTGPITNVSSGRWFFMITVQLGPEDHPPPFTVEVGGLPNELTCGLVAQATIVRYDQGHSMGRCTQRS